MEKTPASVRLHACGADGGVVIIGILATVVTVSVTDYLVTGKQTAARTEIAQMGNALELFYLENDRYPSNDEGLTLLKNRLFSRICG